MSNGDYLVGMDGDFNVRCWQGEQALLNQRVMRISDWKCEVCPEFIKLPLQFVLDFLHSYTSQTTVKHLSAKQVNGIEIPLPPLEEQHRIVAKVGELMALLDFLEAERGQREEIRDKLTMASFSRLIAAETDAEEFKAHADFAIKVLPDLTTRPDQIKVLRQTILDLAVRGKLVAQSQDDSRNNQLALRADSNAEFYDRQAFKSRAGLFCLPENWIIEPLSAVSEAIVDCQLTTPKLTQEGVFCIKTNQVRAGVLDLSSPYFVSEETYRGRVERLEPKTDDILYIREGGVLGVGCRIPSNTRLCLGQRLMLIRPNVSVTPHFLEICLNSPWITEFAAMKTTGGAAPRVNMSVVRGYPIPVPPLAEQNRIVSRVQELVSIFAQLEQELMSGQHTRGQLLKVVLDRLLAPAEKNAA